MQRCIHVCMYAYKHTRKIKYIHTFVCAFVDTPAYMQTHYIRTYIQTYKKKCMHTCMAAFMPEFTYEYIHAFMPAYIHTYIHAYINTNIYTHTHTYTHTQNKTNIHIYIHTWTQTCIHAYVHKYTHTNIHAHIVKNWMRVCITQNIYDCIFPNTQHTSTLSHTGIYTYLHFLALWKSGYHCIWMGMSSCHGNWVTFIIGLLCHARMRNTRKCKQHTATQPRWEKPVSWVSKLDIGLVHTNPREVNSLCKLQELLLCPAVTNMLGQIQKLKRKEKGHLHRNEW